MCILNNDPIESCIPKSQSLSTNVIFGNKYLSLSLEIRNID